MSDDLLHDLKQPLNLIRVLAQDVRLDVTRKRLEISTLPETMTEIEEAVDELVARLDELRAWFRLDPRGPSGRDDCGSAEER